MKIFMEIVFVSPSIKWYNNSYYTFSTELSKEKMIMYKVKNIIVIIFPMKEDIYF